MRFEWEKTEIKGQQRICITGCNGIERLTIPEEEDEASGS